MKILDIPQSGKRRDIVSFKSRYGQCQRQLVVPKNQQTPAREHMRGTFGHLARAWSTLLTQAQRDASDASGAQVQSTTIAPPDHPHSCKHVASMFLGCSLLVSSFLFSRHPNLAR